MSGKFPPKSNWSEITTANIVIYKSLMIRSFHPTPLCFLWCQLNTPQNHLRESQLKVYCLNQIGLWPWLQEIISIDDLCGGGPTRDGQPHP